MEKFDITSAPLTGRAVIEASAGTGKTYAIAGLFLRLILGEPITADHRNNLNSAYRFGLKVNQILVVTFTVAATEELRDRIRRRLRDALNALTENYTGSDPVLLWVVENFRNDKNGYNRLKEAIVCFDESAIFTIHGFCQKMLSENAFESNALFDTELLTDESDILIEVCRDFYRKNFLNMNPILFSNPCVKGITPEYLLKLIRAISVDPDFTIIPNKADVAYMSDGNDSYDDEDDAYMSDGNDGYDDEDDYKKKKIYNLYTLKELEAHLTSAMKMIQTSYSSIQKRWIQEGEKIGEAILNAQQKGAFNGKYIRNTTYPNAINWMHVYIKEGNCWSLFSSGSSQETKYSELFTYVEKFTNRFMSEKAKDVNKIPSHHFFQEIEDFISSIVNIDSCIRKFCLNLKLNFLEFAKDALQKKKMVRNVRSFDDLLDSMYKAIGKGDTLMAAAVRNRFSAALIDEFQDTDPLQYSIFINIFQGKNSLLYLIGDPKQAIYGFRGADIYAYLKARKSVESSFTLGTNWRSDSGLVAAVNCLFNIKGRNPFIIDGIDFIPVSHSPDRAEGSLYIDGKVSLPMNIAFIDKILCNSQRPKGFITRSDTERFVARFTANKISELINFGALGKAVINEKGRGDLSNSSLSAKNLGPQDIAVLVRTNRQSSIMLQELIKLEIPGVIYSAGSVYEEEESLEMERFMRAVAEPSNEKQLKTALITGFFGFNASQIFQLSRDEKLYDSLLNEFLEYNNIWKKSGFISMWRYMIQLRGVKEKLLGYIGGERKLTNYLHLAELLHIADLKFKPGIDGLINFLSKRRLAEEDKTGVDEYRLRLETDDMAVKIITIHRSKGLEFPVVFCPYLYYSTDVGKDDFIKFHDASGRQTLDLGSENFEQNKNAVIKEDFAESIRLAYVAVTRAKYACFIMWGRINKSENSPLSWLFHGDKVSNENISKKEKLEQYFDDVKAHSWEDMKSDIEAICKKSGGTIGVEIVNTINPQPYIPTEEQQETLLHRTFKGGVGKIPNGWKISSFTSIFSGKELHSPDHDEMFRAEIDNMTFFKESDKIRPDKIESDKIGLDKIESNQAEFEQISFDEERQLSSGFFGFPKGARAGSCIHEIMEAIDFTNFDIKIVKEKIEKFGFENAEIGKVEEMINRILESVMLPNSIYLKQVKNEHRINEMEFFLPVSNMNYRTIASAIEKYGSGAATDFVQTMENIGLLQKGGYLKGFIDMIFFHNKKFYIVDWKTNHLGNKFDDYSLSTLNGEMVKSGYVLQYLLYSVALNLYLKKRVINYSYDDHFGGVFYIFMRGIKPESNTGIYFDCPDKRLVEELTIAITGGL